jgi:glycosyltransferase involved in cell wall biosynthesis
VEAVPRAIFVIHLVQDVSILRPLIFMAARDFRFDTLLLVATTFGSRDTWGIWRKELDEICAGSGARLEYFGDDWEANRNLTGHGLLIAASESHLPQHATVHDLFRHAPSSYLRVTLQHGFECVGFRHSNDHVRAHGPTASFGADIVCAWTDVERLSSLAPSQRAKVVVTGPTTVLQMHAGPFERNAEGSGLVCENLHSVRFNNASDTKAQFVKTLAEFAREIGAAGQYVTLRTHPGGQYAVRNKLALPPNVQVENAPMYRLDLRTYSYGISAPSSVLIDMLLAGIPTAVWRDTAGELDAASYEGLETVTSAREWLQFAREAEQHPDAFVRRQKKFLDGTGMPLDPQVVFSRFAELFRAARGMEVRAPGAVAERERILFVANGKIPTYQLSFEKVLAPLVARGEFATALLTEHHMRAQFDALGDPAREAEWINHRLDAYNPSVIVFCRYSGPAYQPILDWAQRGRVPVIYHIDDDLLAVPRDIGERKFAVHNAPARLDTVKTLINSADLVYASTEPLKKRLLGYFPQLPVTAGKIYCSGKALRKPARGPTRKVGYMASADHAHNLEMVLPAVEQLLERNPHLQFELFGSIPLPEQLKRFGDRVLTTPAVANYEAFLEDFAAREWDVGICPLTPIDFNMMKANTKWVEYSSAGAAVVASRGTVYDDCCAGGCGILAEGVEEWFSALDLLVNNVEERVATVARAQEKLEQEFSIARLREQVLNIIAQGHAAVASRLDHEPSKEEVRVCQLP